MNNPLDAYRSMNQITGLGQGLWPSYPVLDQRPLLERLQDRQAANDKTIADCQQQNDAIAEAIALIQDHPHVARLHDLLAKLGLSK